MESKEGYGSCGFGEDLTWHGGVNSVKERYVGFDSLQKWGFLSSKGKKRNYFFHPGLEIIYFLNQDKLLQNFAHNF